MGFFDDAEEDVVNIPDDPFGFGNDFWPVRIIEIGDPKVTEKGDKFGMMIKWMLDDPKFAGHWVQTKGLGNGNWVRLPVPKALQEQGVPWSPKTDQKANEARIAFKNLLLALGFGVDEMGKVGREQMLHRGMLTKIKPDLDENGFWRFRFNNIKAFPSGEGSNEFARPDEGLSEEARLKKELDDI